MDADIKLLVEFLDAVRRDTPKDAFNVSSLDASPPSTCSFARDNSLRSDPSHTVHANVKSHQQLLSLLLENEIIRLNVWSNPTNDPKRGADHVNSIERSFSDVGRCVTHASYHSQTFADDLAAVSPDSVVDQPCHCYPHGHAVQDSPRSNGDHTTCSGPHQRRSRYTRSRKAPRRRSTRPCIVARLTSEWIATSIAPYRPFMQRLQYLPLFAPVPPIIAITFFEPKFLNNPLTLQYAYRVLALHPVALTFFFVPQIVQALRSDPSGPCKWILQRHN